MTVKRFIAAAIAAAIAVPVAAQDICEGYGPQTPRDISEKVGINERLFTIAPSVNKMNLCNIHTHTNAEHKGPSFSVYAGDGTYGGYKCNNSDDLTDAELAPVEGFEHAAPGDTIEVHWVHTSCAVTPGAGLGSCLSDACANPQLRVEAQVFLLVNDSSAADFMDYAYQGNVVDGLHQAKAIPEGDPVVFQGSTTGPSYTAASKCSPLQVTWSVRPSCVKLDINSLVAWGKSGNVFEEKKSHGVRALVTAPELLSPIN
jgi:hypothetical protein